jgi:hypothetical protein
LQFHRLLQDLQNKKREKEFSICPSQISQQYWSMDQWINGGMDGWMVGWMDGWMIKQNRILTCKDHGKGNPSESNYRCPGCAGITDISLIVVIV